MIKIPVSSKKEGKKVRKAGFEPVYILEPTALEEEFERVKALFESLPAQKAISTLMTALVLTGTEGTE